MECLLPEADNCGVWRCGLLARSLLSPPSARRKSNSLPPFAFCNFFVSRLAATSAPDLDMLTFMGRMNTLKIHQQIAKLSLTVSIDRVALYSLVRLSVRLSPWWHLHLSPPCDVLDHTNHIFSESLSSGDDNDRDKYKYKDTHIQTKTNTKCFQDPMYAKFIKRSGFKYLKYHIGL